MVSAWDTPSAAIVVGLMLLTPGTGTTAVTANACDPEQSAAVVALTERGRCARTRGPPPCPDSW